MLKKEEQLNEDEASFDPEFRANSPYTRYFSKYLVDGWRKNSGSGTNHWLHSQSFQLLKTVLLPNNTAYG
jgi:hypothetical protein